MRFIKGAQRIGLRLREVKELLSSGIAVSARVATPRVSSIVACPRIDVEIADLRETKRELLAFKKRFAAIECPEGAEPWPCAQEFVALADGREVHANGRSPVVPANA